MYNKEVITAPIGTNCAEIHQGFQCCHPAPLETIISGRGEEGDTRRGMNLAKRFDELHIPIRIKSASGWGCLCSLACCFSISKKPLVSRFVLEDEKITAALAKTFQKSPVSQRNKLDRAANPLQYPHCS